VATLSTPVPADELEPGAEVIVESPPHLRMAEGRS
jgi:hypothetical protein